jgi:hypothetical protein
MAMGDERTLVGKNVGRFKVSRSTADQLVLTGRAGTGILYLVCAAPCLALAAAAWASVLAGRTQTLNAAAVLTVLSLILLFLAASTLGTRIVFDGNAASVNRTMFFGLSKKVLAKPTLAFVSISVLPATLKVREKTFLHLMNDRQLVELYIVDLRTDAPAAVQLIDIAERISTLLKLRPRCEGTPTTAPQPFIVAYQRWTAICPDGVQPLRRQVA